MEKVLEKIMKNKILSIFIIVIIILFVIFFVFIRGNITFKLIGEDINIEFNSIYNDPGFIALNGLKSDISSHVTVTDNINTSILGTYEVEYNLKYFGVNKSLKRNVNVISGNINDYEIVLDSDVVYLLVGSTYYENGGYLLNKISNEKVSSELKIDGVVNNQVIGEYYINYEYLLNDKKIEKKRKVVVYDIITNINPNIKTMDDVDINLDIKGINYEKIVLPNNSVSFDTNISYKVNSNGNYIFKIYTRDNNIIEKEIKIDNIIKKYTCRGVLNRNGISLEVNPKDNILKYEWNIDNKIYNGNSEFIKNIGAKNASVKLYYLDGSNYEVKCNIEDKLIYHFVYDENNTKAFMKCNTYTLSDKVELDNKLKNAVMEAGYGTRAGVVEAARFLVGALKYKVPYMGPKMVNSDIGRYSKVGLNIGQKGAWGCSVNGWTQGMDCTNFIKWAFSQNGISDHPYSNNRNKTLEVVNNLRVGDLLYSLCSGECKSEYNLAHVGIIIGIDDNYFYVAEATTGSVNAAIVSKWERRNMPRDGKFSLAKLYSYASDGNITNMWIE